MYSGCLDQVRWLYQDGDCVKSMKVKRAAAATIFDLLSVVKETCWLGFSSHSRKVDSTAPAYISAVWSAGRKCFPSDRDWIFNKMIYIAKAWHKANA